MSPLQLKRVDAATLAAATPASGEPVWTTDTNNLYVGDGATVGGVAISGGAAGDSFKTINCPAGTDPVADSATDTLNLASGTTALTITGDSATDTVTLAVADVGASSGLMTNAQSTKLAGIETAADVTDAANVDAAGAVMEADYNAQTILAATADNTPAALTVGEQTLVGRITAGNIAALTATQVRTLLNVEDGADVTDAANVDAAGAVMEADYGAQTVLAATLDNTPAALTVGEQTLVGRKTGGNIAALTGAEVLAIAGGAAASHVHAAADITSGTLVHEQGGLEADVSAYAGLVKIAAGATSAVTIGIASANALIVDAAGGAPADDEYARFTANGLEGRTEAEFKADFNLEIGTDVAAQGHVSTASGVHGVTGSVVGTTDTQTLSAKDLTAETNKIHFSKSITFENPVLNDCLVLYMDERAVTAKGVSFCSVAGTSVAFEVQFNTTPVAGGTVIHADTCASSTPEWDVAPSGTAAVTTDRICVVVIGTVTGSVTQFHVTVEFDEA